MPNGVGEAGDGRPDERSIGGFECATHRRRDGHRLDLIRATHHDVNAAADYRMLADHGICTVRDGLRWNRIESWFARLCSRRSIENDGRSAGMLYARKTEAVAVTKD
jgi:hypothetical protein